MPWHWNCSCRSAGGTEAFLLVPEVTSFQPLPLQDSPFPRQISTDSPCSSFGMVGDSGSCTCLWEYPVDLLFISSSDVSTVCWHLPASPLLGNTDHLSVLNSCRQDHCLPIPASRPPCGWRSGELHPPSGARSDSRSLMFQGQLLQMVLGTVSCGASPPLLNTHTVLSRVSGSLLRELLCKLLYLLAVFGSGALGPACIWASP